MLTVTPMPIGTLFKCLSQESRSVLSRKKLPLETFLLRQKEQFAVFQEDRTIMAARADKVPITAHRAVESSTEAIFNGQRQDTELRDVYLILKYVPNEWSSYTSLGIPDAVKKAVFKKETAKRWMERFPAFFECKAQSSKGHTFDVRRSLELQHRAARQNERGKQ